MIHDWYETYQRNVDLALVGFFKERYVTIGSDQENNFQEAIIYAVGSSGKRIRPILAMIMYEEIMGLPSDSMLQYIIGIELIHTYAMVHDDLPSLDNDEFRRGEMTVWKKYGEATAILVGDALLAMGLECLSHAKNPFLVSEMTASIGDMGMIRGQIRDVLADHMSMEQKDLIRLHDEKTGKLIASSLIMGALLGGMQSPEVLDKLRWFGTLLGRAFQVRDDILDYEGNERTLGKSVGKDVARQKGIVAFMGIEKSKLLLDELEIALLEIAGSFQTSKFSDIAEFIIRRDNK